MTDESKPIKQPEVIVTITGDINSGKTNIAALIAEMLFNYNGVAVTVQCVDGDVGKRMIDLKDIVKRGEILKKLQKSKIVIIDNN